MSLVDSVVIKGIKLHLSHVCGIVLKLLGQLSESPCNTLGLLVDTPSCKLDVSCDESTLCVEYGLVNFWSSSHLSKNDVSMVPYDLLLLNLENRNLVNRPCLVTFEHTHYEDPFLYMPSLVEKVKSFMKMFKDLGIASVGMNGPNGNKVLGDYVTWHVNYFYCMSIKPFNGVGTFYRLFVKNFISNGFVWDYIVKDRLVLFAPTSCSYIVRIFEFWYEGYLDVLVLILCVRDLDMKEFMNLCSHSYCDLALSLMEHKFGGSYNAIVVVLPLRVVSGPNLFHHTLIFDLLSYYFIGVRNPDLRANPFQGGEGDMTTSARCQGSSLRHEPWIDWGPRMKEKTCQGSNKARGPPEDARNREGPDLRTNPFQEGEDDTTMEAVHQSSYLQLALISSLLVDMTSKSLETATIVFVFERASREYLTRPNRSPEERVMAVLLKLRSTESSTRAGGIWPLKYTRPGGYPKAWRGQRVLRDILGHLFHPGG